MLSRTPATLPCRNCAFNARCPDKYFIFFLQRGNNVGWERRKKIYKLKKVCGHRVVNTTMLSQVPEFRRILEECTHVEPHLEKRRLLFRWKQHWWIAHRITTLFAYSSATSEGTENELSIYLEAGSAIDQCNGLTACTVPSTSLKVPFEAWQRRRLLLWPMLVWHSIHQR